MSLRSLSLLTVSLMQLLVFFAQFVSYLCICATARLAHRKEFNMWHTRPEDVVRYYCPYFLEVGTHPICIFQTLPTICLDDGGRGRSPRSRATSPVVNRQGFSGQHGCLVRSLNRRSHFSGGGVGGGTFDEDTSRCGPDIHVLAFPQPAAAKSPHAGGELLGPGQLSPVTTTSDCSSTCWTPVTPTFFTTHLKKDKDRDQDSSSISDKSRLSSPLSEPETTGELLSPPRGRQQRRRGDDDDGEDPRDTDHEADAFSRWSPTSSFLSDS
jgi:hypothetical protein